MDCDAGGGGALALVLRDGVDGMGFKEVRETQREGRN
jgi:hypothetical protein